MRNVHDRFGYTIAVLGIMIMIVAVCGLWVCGRALLPPGTMSMHSLTVSSNQVYAIQNPTAEQFFIQRDFVFQFLFTYRKMLLSLSLVCTVMLFMGMMQLYMFMSWRKRL